MRELTDEQYREIGRGLGYEESNAVREGRAAYAASFPYAVAEALEELGSAEVRMEWEREWANDEYRHNNFPSDKGFRTMGRVIERRLSRLTAKPDPAVEAVKAAIEMYGSIVNNPEFHTREAKRIVAAVDEARKGAK